MKLYLVSLLLLVSSLSFAEGEISLLEPFKSGSEIYNDIMTGKDQEAAKRLVGKFVQVPLDYQNPQVGQLPIYYRTSPDFNPALPTVLFFYGGPGGNSWAYQFEKNVSGVNFIYMDQRGTGFSKPTTLTELQTTDYFRSEYIARDAELVRAAVGVDKVAVYGHSYGTLVAQVYASLFSTHTTSLILEGVIYDGTVQLWSNPHRLKLLNRFFTQLPKTEQEKFQAFTQRADVPDEWLAELAQQVMYDGNFKEKLLEAARKFIDEYDKQQRPQKVDMLTSESKYFGAYMFNHIACKELSRSADYANFSATLTKEGKFIPFTGNGGKTCKTLIGFEDSKVKTYQAVNYPVTAPTTYFQGTEDGATGAPNAIYHYKTAAKGNAQLILVTRQGHSPLIRSLTAFTDSDVIEPQYAELFKIAVQGKLITKEQLQTANKGKSKWVMTSRWKS